MVVNLTADHVGQVLEFSYRTPLRGLSEINSFLDSITNETVNRYFSKKFRYTLDGVKYSDWYDLTLFELQTQIHVSGVVPIKSDLIIQFQYERAGADQSGDLTVNSVTVGGIWSMEYLQVLDFEGTVFEDISFTDEYWNEVWINLLNKLYKKGIIPEFVDRTDNFNSEDEDFIVFWKSMAYYFALLIALVDKKITHLIDDEVLLSEYLIQRNLLICRDQTIDQLQNIANITNAIVRERGTKGITRIGTDYLYPQPDPDHGELLRMICFDVVKDEFLFEYIRGGLYINSSWPTYFGLVNHLQLNKAPEQTQDFVDLSKFITTGTVSIETDSPKEIARISPASSLSTKSIKVDDSLAYQVSFFVRQISTDGGFNVFLDCTDENEFAFPVIHAGTGAVVIGGGFVTSYQFADVGEYYWFTASILNHNAALLTSSTIESIAAGRHLKMSEGTKRIKVRIGNTGSNFLHIWDLKITPLLNTLTSEFINGVDVSNVWLKNNNLYFSDTDIRDNLERYLIPKGAIVNTTILP